MSEIAVLVHEHHLSITDALELNVRQRDHWVAVANFWQEARRGSR